MLDSLKGLSIKGFYDWYYFSSSTITVRAYTSSSSNEANTPSSTNASLPTPPALKSSLVLLASPADSLFVRRIPYLFTRCLIHQYSEGWYTPQVPIQQPGAPRMKDLDSFTEGTGQGSFDFLPLTTAEEGLPLIFHPSDSIDHMEHSINCKAKIPPTNPLTLDLLPSPSNLEDAVLAWRENVVNPSLLPPLPTLELPVKKRRRSPTLDEDDEERRTRVWSPSPQSSPASHAEPHAVGYPTRDIELKTPD